MNMSDAVQRKLGRFLTKPKRVLLYDSQKHHLKAFRSHFQCLALPSQTVIFT